MKTMRRYLPFICILALATTKAAKADPITFYVTPDSLSEHGELGKISLEQQNTGKDGVQIVLSVEAHQESAEKERMEQEKCRESLHVRQIIEFGESQFAQSFLDKAPTPKGFRVILSFSRSLANNLRIQLEFKRSTGQSVWLCFRMADFIELEDPPKSPDRVDEE